MGATDGRSVGAAVGKANDGLDAGIGNVGAADGRFVGADVGRDVGAAVGRALGSVVGEAIGANVGIEVGEEVVGVAVGYIVGALVGVAEGACEGAKEGKKVGMRLGILVGTLEGAEVVKSPVGASVDRRRRREMPYTAGPSGALASGRKTTSIPLVTSASFASSVTSFSIGVCHPASAKTSRLLKTVLP